MSAEKLTSKLKGLKKTGDGRWVALCPAHDDKSPSLAIRELEDGRVLVHCFAGCSVGSVLSAVGISFSDLFPARDSGDFSRSIGRPFPASDILRAIAFEALVVMVAAQEIHDGRFLKVEDRGRLRLAIERIQSALAAGGLIYG